MPLTQIPSTWRWRSCANCRDTMLSHGRGSQSSFCRCGAYRLYYSMFSFSMIWETYCEPWMHIYHRIEFLEGAFSSNGEVLLQFCGGTRSSTDLNRSPKRVVFWLVVQKHGFTVWSSCLEIVQYGSLQAQLRHTAPQFLCSLMGIMHREHAEARKPPRIFGYLFCHVVVRSTGKSLYTIHEWLIISLC